MSFASARPVCELISYPTGCCIHELAVRMKKAESHVPIQTR